MIGAINNLDDPVAVVRELQRRHFPAFLVGAFPLISGGADLAFNWHIDAIAHQLGRVEIGDCRRLLVTMPPRHLKSIAISVAWVAWRLGRDPRLNFVCVSYSGELAEKHARDCRAIMMSSWFRELFPRTIISERNAVHDFRTTAGGGRLATSITGTLTGRGGDIIIVDDPIKPDEAFSDATRDKVNDWFSTTLASRLNDKKRGAILVVMQRLHQYDLVGMLEERGGWDRLSLPSIAPEHTIIPLTRHRSYQRAAGEVLHASRDSPSTVEQIKAQVGSTIFVAQYQQDPVPAAGNIILADWLRYHELSLMPGDVTGQIVQSWDTASKEGVNNDWSACITARIIGRDVHILDVWRRRVEFPALKKAAIAQAAVWRASTVLIEDQASGMQLLQMLRAELAFRSDLLPQRPEQDKQSRVAGVSSMIEAGRLHLPREAPWLADFKSEILAFPSGRFDDQVDALSQLLSWVNRTDRPPVIICGAEEISVDPDHDPEFETEDDYDPLY